MKTASPRLMGAQMKAIFLATTILVSTAATAQLPPAAIAAAQHERELKIQYQNCVIDATIALGRNNHEDAATVVRGAQSKCGDTLTINGLKHAEIMGSASFGYLMSQDEAEANISKFVSQVSDRAIAALLEARAK